MMRRELLTFVSVLSGMLMVAAGLLPTAGQDSLVSGDGGSLVVVLDGSGSMAEPSGDGRSRMDAAKEGLGAVIAALPDGADVGLRVYGSTIADGAGSCEDTTLLVPVKGVDRAALTAGVQSLSPLGNTPIAYSLTQAVKDLPQDGPRSIVLVSDGEENCGGDPCTVARDLRGQGADLYVDVVGLQVDQASRDQLTCIAAAGGGTYYDVQDISRLDATLERVAVRAARGYVETGLSVEGGVDLAQAAEIADGQWLDTIGDSGAEFYALPEAGDATLHVSASTRTTSEELSSSERLAIAVVTADGEACVEADASVVGVSNTKAPYAASASIDPATATQCGEGPFFLRVDPPEVAGVKPLELLVTTEPPITNADDLPPAAESGGYSAVTAPPAEGPAEEVLGSVSFTGAPVVGPGLYTDSIIAGETLLYRVTGVDWGQQVVCDITLGQAAGSLSNGNVRATQARVYSEFRTEVTEILGEGDDGVYSGDDLALHVAGPPLIYANRTSTSDEIRASSTAGDLYCGVSVRATSAENDAEIGNVPVTLSVAIVGDVSGAPEYVSAPTETPQPTAAPDPQEDAASGLPGWMFVGAGVVAVLAVAGILVIVLRRRKAGARASR